VLTTGGKLAELARAEGVPVIGVPAGMQPRAAVIYMTIGVIECAALCGAAPALHAEIDTPAAARAARRGVGSGRGRDSLAKSVARSSHGTIPVIHGPRPRPRRRGAGHPDQREREVARLLERAARGRTTTRSAAGSAAASWPALRRLPVRPRPAPARPAPRRAGGGELDARGRAGCPGHTEGDSRLERVLSACCWATLVSVYMARARRRGPHADAALARLKQQLLRRNRSSVRPTLTRSC
jgi:glucose/mannose-6-phosphate isomerase